MAGSSLQRIEKAFHVLGPYDHLQRATGVGAQIGPDSLGGETRFAGYPKCWNKLPVRNGATGRGRGWERGHLLAGSLGGPGDKEFRNMVPLTKRANSTTHGFDGFERRAREAARNGECILAFIVPFHIGANYAPDVVFIEASGNRGFSYDGIIYNDDR